MTQPLITTNDIKDSAITDTQIASGVSSNKLTGTISSGNITAGSVGYEKTKFAIAPNMLQNGSFDNSAITPPAQWTPDGGGMTVTVTGDGVGDTTLHSRPATGPGVAQRFEVTSGSGAFIAFHQDIDLVASKYVRSSASGGGPVPVFPVYLTGYWLNTGINVSGFFQLSVIKNGTTVIAGPVSFNFNSQIGLSGTPWRPFILSITVPDPGVTVSSLVVRVEVGEFTNGSSAGQYTYVDDLALFSSTITG